MAGGRLFLFAAACALGVLIACAPKPVERVSPTERACLEAAKAESSVATDQARYQLVQSQIAERQARLVELQRLRSKIVTKRMSDEELVQWGRDTTKVQAPAEEAVQETTLVAAADTAHAASADTTLVAAADTAHAASADTTLVAATDTASTASTDTAHVEAPPVEGSVPAPSDTTQGVAPVSPSTGQEPSSPPSTEGQPAPEAQQPAPPQQPEEQAAPESQPEEQAPSAPSGGETDAPSTENAP